jgi:uncharacterized protein YacL
MNRTLLAIRCFFLICCVTGGMLITYAVPEWDAWRWFAAMVGLLIGTLVVLVDILLKGFSLRGLSALTFGLAIGSIIAWLIGSSPLFAVGDPESLHLARLTLFVVVTYLAAVVALRGKDEFNLVIPYVRFVPQDVESPVVVADASALVDGRIVDICEAGFLASALVVPRFVIRELQHLADSEESGPQARGRRGLEALNRLRRIKRLDIRLQESELEKGQDPGAKLIFIAQSLKAKLVTTDYNLSKIAEFHGVDWLNINGLMKALHPDLAIGAMLHVLLAKPGREENQGVGYMPDGSMVVVTDARGFIGRQVAAEVTSVLPSAGGRMVFARFIGES